MPTEVNNDDESRARALALLEATYQFPCAYEITVIAFNLGPTTEAVRKEARIPRPGPVADIDGVAADVGAIDYQSRASREGKYMSHRFSIPVNHAGDVLELFARLRAVEGVVTLL